MEGMKKRGIRVPGIGHRIKSKDNRDKRVELLQNYARKCVRSKIDLNKIKSSSGNPPTTATSASSCCRTAPAGTRPLPEIAARICIFGVAVCCCWRSLCADVYSAGVHVMSGRRVPECTAI